MKTLVIHPKDPSTDMLSTIYMDKKDWTIINDCTISNQELTKLINEHDRIIMLGHGSPNGLFNSKFNGFIIDQRHVDLLKQKKECVYIWCNADQFIKKHNITNCLATGMIISETKEAYFCGVKSTQEEINHSNTLFSESIRDNIDLLPKQMCESSINKYNTSNNSDVINFNRGRIYHF